IIMAIPTIISGFYGMNVKNTSIPFAGHPFGFAIVAAMTVVIVLVVLIVLRKKKML
ncbi:MAG: magnesium transporter CorA family protein, partial [Lachnospiraceae bacterium]|nr:magnesium transporter CorA family protein [Lachnospiraceae bacterium]